MDYYVYAYCDCNTPVDIADYQFSGQPFYIGSGKNARMLSHLKEARSHLLDPSKRLLNPHKTRKIQQMLRNGTEPRIQILKSGLSVDAARLEETRLIAAIPNLTNIALGGTGGDTLTAHPRAGNWGTTFDHRGSKNPMFGRRGQDNPKTKLYVFQHEDGTRYEVLGGEALAAFF